VAVNTSELLQPPFELISADLEAGLYSFYGNIRSINGVSGTFPPRVALGIPLLNSLLVPLLRVDSIF